VNIDRTERDPFGRSAELSADSPARASTDRENIGSVWPSRGRSTRAFLDTGTAMGWRSGVPHGSAERIASSSSGRSHGCVVTPIAIAGVIRMVRGIQHRL
jgi:hypothetical protein